MTSICDIDNNIRNVTFMFGFLLFSEKNEADITCPKKCIFLLLNRIFFGVSKKNSIDAPTKTFTSDVCVSFDFHFSYTSKVSETDALNYASLNALQCLCDIENGFIQRKRNSIYPTNFAHDIQRYFHIIYELILIQTILHSNCFVLFFVSIYFQFNCR